MQPRTVRAAGPAIRFALLLTAAFVAQALIPCKLLDRTGTAGSLCLLVSPETETVHRPEAPGPYGQLAMHFEPSGVQGTPEAQYQSFGAGYALFLSPTEAALALRSPLGREGGPEQARVVRMQLLGADSAARMTAAGRLPGKSNYFLGTESRDWRTDVPHYQRIRCEEIYPQVDVVYYGNQRQLEYDFLVRPGGDISDIRLKFLGAEHLGLDDSGNLVIQVAEGILVQRPPFVYQMINDTKQPVEGTYALRGSDEVGFAVPAYDPRHTVVIDPVLTYSTFLGGEGDEAGYALRIDDSGCTYITGITYLNIPTTTGAPQTVSGGLSDAFVIKLDASGSSLVYSSYLGGSGYDQGRGLAIDAEGCAYVTGVTQSPNFPTSNPLQPTLGGLDDAFVAKLDPSGSSLVYSTYMGGTSIDRGYAITVDAEDSAYLTGQTYSADFPSSDAFQPGIGGSGDVFVTKLNPAGSLLAYSTFLGGTGKDMGYGIAVDRSGCALVTGETRSADFPSTGNAAQSALSDRGDAFLTKLDASGTLAVYSTYLGGTDYDHGSSVAVDLAGNAYLTGRTRSFDFPITAGAYQGTFGGSSDAFVGKVDPSGSLLVYSTFLGGSDADQGYGIAVDSSGRVYVTGETRSVDFPTGSALQAVNAGGFDTFVCGLGSEGTSLAFSTYLGGSGNDHGLAIAIDALGAVYVTGRARSDDFPTAEPFQADFGGGPSDIFIAWLQNPMPQSPLAVEHPGKILVECTSPSGTEASVPIAIRGGAGNALTVSWHVDGDHVRTDVIPAGDATMPVPLSFSHVYALGPHTVALTVDDRSPEPVSATVSVEIVDTTGPTVAIQIPRDGARYTTTERIDVTYTANDNADSNPSVRVLPRNPVGPPLNAGSLMLVVDATDASGNSSSHSVMVRVDPIRVSLDLRPPVIGPSASQGWISAYIELPEVDGSLQDIDPASIELVGPLGTALPFVDPRSGVSRATRQAGSERDRGEVRVVRFEKESVGQIVEGPVSILTIRGRLLASSSFGQAAFEGSDELRVKGSKGKGQLAKPVGEPAAPFVLHQNSPNPFNPTTAIRYSLSEPGPVSLTVFNALGQAVRGLIDDYRNPGSHRVEWDGRDSYGRRVASGLYFYRLRVGQHQETRRMLLLE